MLGYDHGEEKFQHAVLLIQDLLDYCLNSPVELTERPEYYARDWTVYVGNDPIWSNNTPCSGGPHLPGFADYYDEYQSTTVPSFGFEEWCNLPGQYTFVAASIVPSLGVRVCDFAVMGTRYIRTTPLTDLVEVDTDSSATLEVENIFSEEDIGNILDIQLRQKGGSELPFVTLGPGGAASYSILIDTSGVAAGDYNLALESID